MQNLFDHQKNFLETTSSRSVLVWETGTGKTRTSIEWSKDKEKTLVICPKSLKTNWDREMKKWGQTSYTIISKEEFRRDWDKIEKHDAVIIDEIHYFLGIKSQMHKTLLKYLKKWNILYRLGLSATVYMSTPLNIYALGRIMGKTEYEWSYPYYMQNFFNTVAMGNRLVSVIRKGAEEEVAKKVQEIGNVVKLRDCADVPPDNFVTEYFALTKEQEKAIKDIPDISYITRWTKTHQICGGTLKGDIYNPSKEYACQKFDRLIDLVGENKKSIIVCRYNHEIETIKNWVNKKTFVVNGKVKDKQAVLDEANATDECVLLVNAACSEGWNASTFDTVIFYSYDFSLKNYVQMKGRIQRIDALQKCNYISLVVQGAIDEDVFNNVVDKKQSFHLRIYEQDKTGLSVPELPEEDETVEW